ncbi:MAG: hypothetical protein AVDCRST_MAG45-1275 [uncultured Solirubrobacterales bacterium]|uniref:PRC-barrel domain-containing protein n=1 Tax=uncultured Solirubrobacterales bacterium TaxID=768556 RepID=A0A6J4SJ62_9ACTN|nr:MAG: hypothetical protein AVDCRST_MAG45-1275 [uncultured Solirubrobacterales bacterium]
MANVREMLAWRGREVVDVDGDRIGRLEEIYLDADTDEAHWAAVKTGLVGGKLSLVPLSEATERADHVAVPFDKRTVKGAPNVDSGAELTPEEESMLHRYYGTGASRPHEGAEEQPAGRDSRDESASWNETDSRRDSASRSGTDSLGGTDSRGGRGRELGRALGAAARNVGQAAMQEARGRGSSAESDRGPHAGGPAGRDERSGRGGSTDERSSETDRPPSTAGQGAEPVSSSAEAEHRPQTPQHSGENERRADEPQARTGERDPHAEEHEHHTHDRTAEAGQPADAERPRGRLRRHVTTEYLSDTGEVERRETHTEEERPQ